MTKHEHCIDIEAPVSTAFQQWEDVESFPQFMDGVEWVTRTSADSTRWCVRIAGVEREFDATFSSVPNQTVAWHAERGVSHAGRVNFVDTGSGTCQVRLAMDMEPDGITETAGEVLGFIDRKISADLVRFKELVEADPTDFAPEAEPPVFPTDPAGGLFPGTGLGF